MRVVHSVPDATSFNTEDCARLLNMMFERAELPGLSQFRVGSVTTTITDTAVPVTFNNELMDTSYAVMIQPESGVSINIWPSNKLTTGFTLNLSLGVNATFAYFAVGQPEVVK